MEASISEKITRTSMRFSCDGCSAQYMISDEKVGPGGVKVRCKKCGHIISVKRAPAAAPAPAPARDEGPARAAAAAAVAHPGADAAPGVNGTAKDAEWQPAAAS